MSIKLKIGIPVAILLLIIAILMAFGIFTLHKSNQHASSIGTWFEENGEILGLNQNIVELVHPHVRLAMGQDFENNATTRESIKEKMRTLDQRLAEIKSADDLTVEETSMLDFMETRILALKAISNEILTLKLPFEHEKGMKLIHELSENHIKQINHDLYQWYVHDLERVDALRLRAQGNSQTYFTISGVLGVLSVMALIMVIWVINRSIITPVVQIGETTHKLATGDLHQRINIDSHDELAKLSTDINNMAKSLETINKQLTQTARTDGLTGVANRRACDEALDQHISSALRYDNIFSVVMLDLDHFKMVNDSHGHECGDQALKEVAQICQRQLRDCDFVFRYGGEEFLILLPNTDKNDSMVVSERIRKAIRSTSISAGSVKLKITASLGISSFPEDGLEKTELVRNADNALYRAKNCGRNQTVMFEKPLLI